jgi:hypothetical protein
MLGRKDFLLRPKLRPKQLLRPTTKKMEKGGLMVLYFAGRMGSVMAIHWILLNTQKSRFILLVGFRV